MKRVILTMLIAVVSASVFACGSRTKTGETLVSVGSEKITTGDLELLGRINPRINAQMSSDFGKKKILDNLVDQELLYQASIKEGLQNDPTVKDKIEIYRRVIISQSYLDKKLEEAAKKNYEENKNDFEKLKMSHILVKFKKDKNDKKSKRSEKEALDLANKAKERIKGEKSFAEVAKQVSEDNLTSKRGGDLGLTSKNEQRLTRRGMGPVLEKAFTMKVGEVEGPIKTEQGYHIIIVTKEAKLQPFEEVSQGILFKIRANERNKVLSELKKKYPVQFTQRLVAAPIKQVVPGTKPAATHLAKPDKEPVAKPVEKPAGTKAEAPKKSE